MNHYRFRSLYHRHREGEVNDISIISYSKRPIVLRDRIPIEYEHSLYLDLWLIYFWVTWKTGIKYRIGLPRNYGKRFWEKLTNK